MKRIGAIAFVVVLALGVLGIGYARWADTLVVHAAVQTGVVKWGFLDCGTSDEGDTIDKTVVTLDPTAPAADRVPHNMVPPKNVGSSECTLVDTDDDGVNDKLEVNLNNVYPCYYLETSFHPYNAGTIPIHIARVKIGDEWITANKYFRLDLSGDGQPDIELYWGNNFHAQLHPGDEVEISFKIHVLQTAEQGKDMSFDALIEAAQYNEEQP
jgi:hypothetical protein